MASDVELKKIKKRYGEKFMHMCRDLFPTILEQEGALFAILENTFANNSRTLYEDIQDNYLEESFKDLIYKMFERKMFERDNEEEKDVIQGKTPYELLDEAGYTLYECKTEKDIQRFKKYYARDEELCTFKGGRLNKCVVFFAVKKNVGEIKRKNFSEPRREDEYGTSVMSIQFSKGSLCTVSIKNRYNHTVRNPDATYGNDLDRIIPGLSRSFINLLKDYGLKFDRKNIKRFKIPGYVVAEDGKYYKYNLKAYGLYYCPGNIVIYKGEVVNIGSPEKKILVENFEIDLENKTVSQYNGIDDSFTDALQDIEKIEIVGDKGAKNGERIIKIKRKNSEAKIEIRIDADNQIIGYENEEVREIGDKFLQFNEKLSQLNLPNLVALHDDFLNYNIALVNLNLPELVNIGDFFLFHNKKLRQLELPKVKHIGSHFLGSNLELKYLKLPALEYADYGVLYDNRMIAELELPKLRRVGSYFLKNNNKLTKLNLPELQEAGDYFLVNNWRIAEANLPKLQEVGKNFLSFNQLLQHLELPCLINAGPGFLGKVGYEGLAKLDKKSNLTTEEVTKAQLIISRLKNFLKKVFNR